MFSKEDFLSFSERIYVLPVIHGSGDFAQEVRDRLLRLEPDCVAVPLPPSFQHEVKAGVEELPFVSMAAAEEPEEDYLLGDGEGGNEIEGEKKEEGYPAYNYVPIDPCQPVIAALRLAAQERIARAFIDLEVKKYEPEVSVLPDPYALKKVPLEAFAGVAPSGGSSPGGGKPARGAHPVYGERAAQAGREFRADRFRLPGPGLAMGPGRVCARAPRGGRKLLLPARPPVSRFDGYAGLRPRGASLCHLSV